MLSLHRVQPYRQQWQDHFGQKRYVPQRAGMQEAESQTRALFRQRQGVCKAAPFERAGQIQIRNLQCRKG